MNLRFPCREAPPCGRGASHLKTRQLLDFHNEIRPFSLSPFISEKSLAIRDLFIYVSARRNGEEKMVSRDELIEIFTEISDFEEMKSFIEEMLTPKEIEDFALRWRLLQELNEGHTQRSIAARYGISLCKITRGSKILKKNNSITKKILDRYNGGTE